MHPPARVLLLQLPKLLREILERAIQDAQDCELICEQHGALDWLDERAIHPDIVILGLNAAADATLVSTLFARWPLVPVMTVGLSGRNAVVHELIPCQQVCGEVSPAEILAALLAAVRRKREQVKGYQEFLDVAWRT